LYPDSCGNVDKGSGIGQEW